MGSNPSLSIPPAASATSPLFRAVAETAQWMNRPVPLVLIAMGLVIALARSRFRGWRAVPGCWMAGGIPGNAIRGIRV
jgi:hypothetical protein